jgi:hypothetical protein
MDIRNKISERLTLKLVDKWAQNLCPVERGRLFRQVTALIAAVRVRDAQKWHMVEVKDTTTRESFDGLCNDLWREFEKRKASMRPTKRAKKGQTR